MKHIISFLFFFSTYTLQAQHLDVEGHSKIRGNLDVAHMTDTTSTNVGRGAGINTVFTQERYNTFIGALAGNANTIGQSNSFYGYGAGFNNSEGVENSFFGLAGQSNTTGSQNTFIGNLAGMMNTTGNLNTAIGFRALYSNTIAGEGGSGNSNVAIGAWALENANSRGNTALGTQTLRNLTDGRDNTAIGEHGLQELTMGVNNTAIGYAAMLGTSGTSSDNVAVGRAAGENSQGSGNTYVGSNSGYNIKQGHTNTLLGNVTKGSDTTANNQIVIGYGADGVKDNSAVIGNEFITDVYMSEDAGSLVHAANAKLNSLPSDMSSDSIVVLRPDSTLAVRETSSLIQSFGQMGGAPLAFGFIDINGNLIKSTGNVSASFSGNTGNASTSNIYTVSVTGEPLTPTSHIVFITPVMVDDTQTNHTRTSGVVFVSGSAKIRFYSTGGAGTSAFNIIVYKY